MKVLITGPGGLIGSFSARKLASQGWDLAYPIDAYTR
jgi:nucleoside-diphosphate-sugar epimerase